MVLASFHVEAPHRGYYGPWPTVEDLLERWSLHGGQLNHWVPRWRVRRLVITIHLDPLTHW
jgi:hypothetical protein